MSTYTVASVKLGLAIGFDGLANPTERTGNVTVEIFAVDGDHFPTGSVLATKTTNLNNTLPLGSQVTSPSDFTEFIFGSSVALDYGTEYAIVISTDGRAGTRPMGSNDPTYPEGIWGGQSYSGSTPYWHVGDGGDLFFELYDGSDNLLENFNDTSTPVIRGLAYFFITGSKYFKEFQTFSTAALPEKPENVTPSDEASNVVGSAGLEWLDPGAEESNAATSFDVYFGHTSISLSLVAEGLTAEQVTRTAQQVNTSFYAAGSNYAWRVDATNEAGTTTGDVWTFDVLLRGSFNDDDDDNRPENENDVPGDDSGADDGVDITTAGGGRHGTYLLAVGHKTVYFRRA